MALTSGFGSDFINLKDEVPLLIVVKGINTRGHNWLPDSVNDRVQDLVTWVILSAQADEHPGCTTTVMGSWLSEWLTKELGVKVTFTHVEVNTSHRAWGYELFFGYQMENPENINHPSDEMRAEVFKDHQM